MGANGRNGKNGHNGNGKRPHRKLIKVPVPTNATIPVDRPSIYDERAPDVWRLVVIGGKKRADAFDEVWPEKVDLSYGAKSEAVKRALASFTERYGENLREILNQADLGFESLARNISRLLNAKKRVWMGKKKIIVEDMAMVAKGVELQMRALGVGLPSFSVGPLVSITNNVLVLPAKETKDEWQKHLEQLKTE